MSLTIYLLLFLSGQINLIKWKKYYTNRNTAFGFGLPQGNQRYVLFILFISLIELGGGGEFGLSWARPLLDPPMIKVLLLIHNACLDFSRLKNQKKLTKEDLLDFLARFGHSFQTMMMSASLFTFTTIHLLRWKLLHPCRFITPYAKCEYLDILFSDWSPMFHLIFVK